MKTLFSFWIPLLLVFPTAAFSQTTVGPCNDSGESSENGPGVLPGSQLQDNCAQVNMDGNLIAPAQCMQSYTHYSAQQHNCLPGVAGSHCDHDKYRVTITQFDDGSCPQIPDLSGIDWTSIGDIVGAIPRLIAALGCKPPTSTTEQSDSADADDCDNKEDPEVLDAGQVVVSNECAHATWLGATPEYTPGPAGIFNPFLNSYDLAQTASPSDLGGPLGALIATELDHHGQSFHATYSVEHFEFGAVDPVSTRIQTLWGTICSDGRFDIIRLTPATYDGSPSTVKERITFDGLNLRSFIDGSEAGNLLPLSSTSPDWVDDVYFQGLHAIYDWQVDPYAIPNIPGVQYTIADGPDADTVTASRFHPLVNSDSFLSEQYLLSIRGGVSVPVQREDFDVQGIPWNVLTYQKFQEFRPGDWRPYVSKETRFYGASPNRDKVVTTLEINRAVPLDAADLTSVPAGFEGDIDWMVWSL